MRLNKFQRSAWERNTSHVQKLQQSESSLLNPPQTNWSYIPQISKQSKAKLELLLHFHTSKGWLLSTLDSQFVQDLWVFSPTARFVFCPHLELQVNGAMVKSPAEWLHGVKWARAAVKQGMKAGNRWLLMRKQGLQNGRRLIKQNMMMAFSR